MLHNILCQKNIPMASLELKKSTSSIYISGLPSTVGQIQLEDICKGLGKVRKIKVYRQGARAMGRTFSREIG